MSASERVGSQSKAAMAALGSPAVSALSALWAGGEWPPHPARPAPTTSTATRFEARGITRRAVRRRVIIAKHLQSRTLAERGVDQVWYQVGFRIVALADLCVRVSAGGIEITQRAP